MSQTEQKKIWQREKEQLLSDKQNQPREVRRRQVELKLGNGSARAKPSIKPKISIAQPKSTAHTTDQLLRKQLGI